MWLPHTATFTSFFWCLGTESNFEKLSTSIATTNGIGYDYRSIMHYSAYAFSRNGQPTIDTLNGVSRNQLGQRSGLSSNDLSHVQKLYCAQILPTTGAYNCIMCFFSSTSPLLTLVDLLLIGSYCISLYNYA